VSANLFEKIDLFLARALFCYERSLNQQKENDFLWHEKFSIFLSYQWIIFV